MKLTIFIIACLMLVISICGAYVKKESTAGTLLGCSDTVLTILIFILVLLLIRQ